MPSAQEQAAEQELLNLEILMQTYQEIAASRMRKIRASVLQNRDFVAGLNVVFQEVKSSYRKEIINLMHKKHIHDPSKITAIKKNGKTISVLLSSNVGLYGEIVKKTFELFAEDQEKNPTDVMIIGKLGKAMFDGRIKRECIYFDYPEAGISVEETKQISAAILPYDKIFIYFGQFQSVVTQNAVALNVYGNQPPIDPNAQPEKINYIFEPSLEKILVFFESEILASVFEQTQYESQLAKYASRLLLLDSAQQNIKDELKKLKFQQRVSHHRLVNAKQLNSLTGLLMMK